MHAQLLTAPGIAVAALFIVAAVLKLRNLGVFAQQLSELSGLPAVVRRPAALAVPALELVGAGLVFAPATRTAGLWLLLALLAAFSTVVARNILAGNVDVACACFGSKSERLGWHIPVRNAALATGLALALVAPGETVAMPELGAWVAVVLATATIALAVEWVRLKSELRSDLSGG
jgi:hypothetical protein